jgi:hypothetical protein
MATFSHAGGVAQRVLLCPAMLLGRSAALRLRVRTLTHSAVATTPQPHVMGTRVCKIPSDGSIPSVASSQRQTTSQAGWRIPHSGRQSSSEFRMPFPQPPFNFGFKAADFSK